MLLAQAITEASQWTLSGGVLVALATAVASVVTTRNTIARLVEDHKELERQHRKLKGQVGLLREWYFETKGYAAAKAGKEQADLARTRSMTRHSSGEYTPPQD